MLNDYIADARNKLTNLVPEKHINALQKIGLLEKEIRRLKIDNKILVERQEKKLSIVRELKKAMIM